jgi:hypothetical protein
MKKFLLLVLFAGCENSAAPANPDLAGDPAATGDPCDGVDCSSPPAASCVDSHTRRQFKKTGTCSAGTCSYDSSDSTCMYGCVRGQCQGEPCDASNCTLPADDCLDSSRLEHFTSASCSSNVCEVDSVVMVCPGGCANNACQAETCPLNQTPSTSLGKGVFTGSYLTSHYAPINTSCFNYKASGYLWQAPSDGVFTFTAVNTYDDTAFGMSEKNQVDYSHIVVAPGTECATTTFPSCPYPGVGRPFVVKLSAGQEVIIALDVGWISTTNINVTRSDWSIDITQCTPNCSNKACGDDGCGGSCGSCGTHQTCSAANQCVCAPSCSGKSCGDDGCGGSCGSCGSNRTCSAAGQCVCAPNCSGKVCGDDGCGGSCGSCGLGTSCSGGSCVSDPNACDPIENLGCSIGNACLLLSTEKTVCAVAGSGTAGSSCDATHTCAGGYACIPPGICRHVCDKTSGEGCSPSQVCNGVSGWTSHGACAP